MISQELRNKIMGNRFLLEVRGSGIINLDEYSALCEALNELAVEWRNAEQIDKEIAEELFDQYLHIWGELGSLDKTPSAEAARKIVYNIDRLIRECFKTERTKEQIKQEIQDRFKLWGEEHLLNTE